MKKYTTDQIKEARERLLEVVKPGDTLHTVLRHVSSSGMSRVISVVKIHEGNNSNGKPFLLNLDYSVAVVLGLSADPRGIKVGGGGMDMGYHLVYSLGSALFGRGEETAKIGHFTGRNGMTTPETDGGYLLNHSWI